MTGNHRQGLRPSRHRNRPTVFKSLRKSSLKPYETIAPRNHHREIHTNTEHHFQQQTLEVKEFRFFITRQRLENVHRFMESKSPPRLATKHHIGPTYSASTSKETKPAITVEEKTARSQSQAPAIHRVGDARPESKQPAMREQGALLHPRVEGSRRKLDPRVPSRR
ncbi:hypothetical protein Rs2_18559 [Raphanus sativus]|nr:hypothetical protein Rs2_18559 [Raphanus sativus]